MQNDNGFSELPKVKLDLNLDKKVLSSFSTESDLSSDDEIIVSGKICSYSWVHWCGGCRSSVDDVQ